MRLSFGLLALALALAAPGAASLAAAKHTSAAAQSVALPTTTPEAVGFSPARLTRLDAAMKGLVDAGHLPGVSTMLIRHGRVVAVHAYGARDLASKAPLTRDTMFRIYSQTKPVTGVAMMILYEEGRWRLDDPVTKYVPEFAHLKVFKGVDKAGHFIVDDSPRAPTMREIMTHTAGFAYGLQTDNPVDAAYREQVLKASRTPKAFIDNVAALPLLDPPGTRWRYSVGVDIQGYIIERLSGMSLADFMRTRIFEPLKMKDTAFYVPADKVTRLATLYAEDRKEHRIKVADNFMVLDVSKPPVAASGGGGLVSTLDDYARFAEMLAGGGQLDGVRILAPATVALMRSNHLSDAVMARDDGPFSFNTANGMGFGLDGSVVLDPARADTLAGKGTYSWGGAAGTWFWVDPENDVVFLGMMHILDKGADPALADIDGLSQRLVYQALVDPKK